MTHWNPDHGTRQAGCRARGRRAVPSSACSASSASNRA